MDSEVKKANPKLTKKLKEFKYPLLVLAAGALLVLWPFGKSDQTPTQTVEPLPIIQTQESYVEQTERRLAEILSSISGAGRVEVMLTVRGSDTTFFQSDTDTSTEEDGDGSRTASQHKTVILSGSGEYDKAAVIKTEHPAFQGALIVSQGAEDAAVRLSLVNAVSSLLGLGTDKITVVKMK